MKNIIILLSIATIFTATSCKVTFTRGLRGQIESQGLDLKKIQYYNSQAIILKRVLTTSETKVASGEVRLENGMNIEQIEIKKNTQGVCDSITKDYMVIRFEQGNGRYLIFKDNAYGEYELKTDRPDPKTVESQSSSGYAQFFEMNKGEVMYEGKKYYTNLSYNSSKLKIKKKETSNVAVERRKASGVKVQ